MKRLITFSILFLTSGFLSAQSPPSGSQNRAHFWAKSNSPNAYQPAASNAWEEKFRAIPSPDSLRAYMKRLSARPHHLGSPYGKDNAEWMLRKFKSWGLEVQIETFEVLFPSPKERIVELIEPRKFKAKLKEPEVPVDPTSGQHEEQLPSYNGYSADGDVTAPLVYVNYGIPEDYEQLTSMGMS
ncbi:MAG: folate hydrolase, partial [bacterium]